jgi:hypothetical protein
MTSKAKRRDNRRLTGTAHPALNEPGHQEGNRKMPASPRTPEASTVTVAPDVAAKLQKELAATIRTARQDYTATVAAAKVTRDQIVARAYAAFAAATGVAAAADEEGTD